MSAWGSSPHEKLNLTLKLLPPIIDLICKCIPQIALSHYEDCLTHAVESGISSLKKFTLKTELNQIC